MRLIIQSHASGRGVAAKLTRVVHFFDAGVRGGLGGIYRILKTAGQILTQDTERFQFAVGGTPPFHPLERRYAKRKLRRYGPQPILTASGAMRRMFTYKVMLQHRYVGLWSRKTAGKSHINLLMLHTTGTSKMPARNVGQRIFDYTIRRILEAIRGLLVRTVRGA